MQLDPKAKKTKTGQYATSEDVLQKLVQNMRSSNIFWNTEPIRN
jgi:DNA polymerase I-like protein with 3'-5' exonuclease and polymerase domains